MLWLLNNPHNALRFLKLHVLLLLLEEGSSDLKAKRRVGKISGLFVFPGPFSSFLMGKKIEIMGSTEIIF